MAYKQVRAQYTREFKQEAVRQVRSGQSMAAVAKVQDTLRGTPGLSK